METDQGALFKGELSTLSVPLTGRSRRRATEVALQRTRNGENPETSDDLLPVAVAVAEAVAGEGEFALLAAWTGQPDEVATEVAALAMSADQDERTLLLMRADRCGDADPYAVAALPLTDLTDQRVLHANPAPARLLAEELDAGAYEAFETLCTNWAGTLGEAIETANTLSTRSGPGPVRPVGKAKRNRPDAATTLYENLLTSWDPLPEAVQRAVHDHGARRGDHGLLEKLLGHGGTLPEDLRSQYETTSSARLRIAYLWSPNTPSSQAAELYPGETRPSVVRARALRSRQQQGGVGEGRASAPSPA